MQDALPPGLVSSVPSIPSTWCMLGNKEHCCPQSQVEATGRLLSDKQPQLTTFEASCRRLLLHTHQRGIHDVLPVGLGEE